MADEKSTSAKLAEWGNRNVHKIKDNVETGNVRPVSGDNSDASYETAMRRGKKQARKQDALEKATGKV